VFGVKGDRAPRAFGSKPSEAVQRVLEESGVEFITGDNGPGVRLRLR